MSQIVKSKMVKRLAGLELNTLVYSGSLPKNLFDKARVTAAGTPIYDLNGEILFYRAPIRKGGNLSGFTDVAANSAFGAPILAVSHGYDWNTRGLMKQAVAEAKKIQRNIKYSKTRFVAFSYPKVAVQFLRGDREVLMLELFSWKKVPKLPDKPAGEQPGNFERWSLLDTIPQATKVRNKAKFTRRLTEWENICPPDRPPLDFKPERIVIKEFERNFRLPRLIFDSRELHYSQENADHRPCYELRSQLTSVWCVAASVQMYLNFFRYNYAQDRIAQALGLGTQANPNGLPYARVGDVVTELENLTNNALTATMHTNPGWNVFKNEIRENRPLISFVPSHSRTVAGYTSSKVFPWHSFRGLLVYDPWPPPPAAQITPMTGGTITRWENFDTQTYQYAYTAQLSLI